MCQMTFEKPALCAGLAKAFPAFFAWRMLVYTRAGFIVTHPESMRLQWK